MSNVIDIKVPDIGGAEDVDVIEILVSENDTITAEQSIITIESEKASMEIPAPQAGVVKSIAVNLGDKESEGILILKLEPSEEAKDTPESDTSEEVSTEPVHEENIQQEDKTD